MIKYKDDPIQPTWWNRNKGKVLGTLAVTSVALVVVQRIALHRHDQFLLGKGLLEEYYYSDGE